MPKQKLLVASLKVAEQRRTSLFTAQHLHKCNILFLSAFDNHSHVTQLVLFIVLL